MLRAQEGSAAPTNKPPLAVAAGTHHPDEVHDGPAGEAAALEGDDPAVHVPHHLGARYWERRWECWRLRWRGGGSKGVEDGGLDGGVQLHGDEPLDALAQPCAHTSMLHRVSKKAGANVRVCICK